eukprot:3466-Heterococcus_DN1.PRE.1
MQLERGLILQKTYSRETTLYRSVVASPERVRLVRSYGLELHNKENLHIVAGLHADIETLAALRAIGMPISENVVNAAALSGRLDILQYLVKDQRCAKPRNLSHFAARSGSISVLRVLREEHACVFNEQTCTGAAAGGYLDALKHLRNSGCPFATRSIARDAACGGSVEALDWLRQQQPGQQTITPPCEHLRSIYGCPLTEEACDLSAATGAVDALRWLKEHGCPWRVRNVCLCASGNGSTDVLDFIIEQGEVLHAELLTTALSMA